MPRPISFTAQLPEAGPRIGRVTTDANGKKQLSIGGSADTAIGPALMAALIPVRKEAGRWIPVDAQGAPASIGDVAWVQSCKDKVNFTIEAPLELWQRPVEGVLVVLVYEEPGASRTFSQNQTAQVEYESPPKGVVPPNASPLSRLPEFLRQGTSARLDALLSQQQADALTPAVTSLPR